MRSIFAPCSIAVVGGGSDLQKPGGRVVWNLKQHGFPVLWVVNAKGEEVQGLPTFSSVDELPGAPDLAILSIPASHVPVAVRGLLDLGTRALIVLSAGFSETDDKGRALEQEIVGMAREAGALLVGPNSLGVFSPAYFGVFGGPALEPVAGTIDFVSASGSTAAFIMEAGLERGLRFASMASVGNSASLGVEDFLAWQDETYEQAPVRAKLLYLESLREPARLLRHARSLHSKGCRVVALKAGVTEVGARAASSHTGAMATSDAAVSALFDKAGVVRVDSKSEMVDVAGILTWARPPRTDDIVIVTHAGGPGIMLADELSRQGFRVPELGPELQSKLLFGLFPGSSARNPIDFLAAGTADHLRHIFRVLAAETSIGAAAVVFGSPGLFDVWPVFQVILEAAREMPFPVYPVLPSVLTAAEEAARFRATGGFYFTDEVALARALGTIRRTPAPSFDAPALPEIDRDAVAKVLSDAQSQGIRQLEPTQVSAILSAAGFRLPFEAVVNDASAAAERACEAGYPVVLKVVGPVHKSDVKGVLIGLRTEEDVREGFTRLMAIPGAVGVLVQKQVQGLELILGVSREERFGHLVMFGLGGVFTETLRDVTLGLAPLSSEEALRMVSAIRAAPLLRGARGTAGVDLPALVRALTSLSALVHHFPGIKEMDINPLMGAGADLVAVDARIEIDPQES